MKIINRISAFALLLSLAFNTPGTALAATSIDLGAASSFAVLAGSGITDTTPSVIVGNVGLSPTTGAAIGLTSGEVTGTIYSVNAFGPVGSTQDSALLVAAKNALTSAYLAAEAQSATTIATELGGTTQTAGVYETASGEFGITGTVTLDAQGDENAIFIFQSGSTLITASNSHVVLTNNAQACNVFWQVTSSATLGTNSDFKGNILALVSITDNGGSTIEGSLLARNGAVTLKNTHVTKANCSVPIVATVSVTSSSHSGEPSRCGTNSTPTCEAFANNTTATATPLAIVLPTVSGLPSTGGHLGFFLPTLLASMLVSGLGVVLIFGQRKKAVKVK